MRSPAEPGLVLQTMPASTAKFSTAWFQSVTFQQACGIQFPSPVPESGFLYWYFSYEELDAVSTAILPEDHGFSYKQLRPIIEGIPAAFRDGKRSVVIAYTIPGIATRFERTFTFQKIHLFDSIQRNQDAAKQAAAVYSHLQAHKLIPSAEIDELGRMPISAVMSGVHGMVKLRDFSCLISDQLVWEELLNARLEMVAALVSAAATSASQYLLLPTFFYSDLVYLFHQSERHYSIQLFQLRERLRSSDVKGFGFLACEAGHYSSYLYQKYSHSVLHYDSLQFPPSTELLPAIEWFLSELDVGLPSQIEVVKGAIQDPGTQSCGLAATNFLEVQIGFGGTIWRGDQDSPSHRAELLVSLVRWHVVSASYDYPRESWWTSSRASTEGMDLVEGTFYGSGDFNLVIPTRYHPVHTYVTTRALQVLNASDSVPSLAPSSPLNSANQFQSLTPPLDTGAELQPAEYLGSHRASHQISTHSSIIIKSSPTAQELPSKKEPDGDSGNDDCWSMQLDSPAASPFSEPEPKSEVIDQPADCLQAKSSTPVTPPFLRHEGWLPSSHGDSKENIALPRSDAMSDAMSDVASSGSSLKPTWFTTFKAAARKVSALTPSPKLLARSILARTPNRKPHKSTSDIISVSSNDTASVTCSRRAAPKYSKVIDVPDSESEMGSMKSVCVKLEPALTSSSQQPSADAPLLGLSRQVLNRPNSLKSKLVKAARSPVRKLRKIADRKPDAEDSDVEFLGCTSISPPSHLAKAGLTPSNPIDLASDSEPSLSHRQAPNPSQQTSPDAATPAPLIGTVYDSFDDALDAVYSYQEELGFKFRKSQSKAANDGGERKKYTLRCSCYGTHTHTHDPTIDPSDHRRGRTGRTACMARASINRKLGTSQWTLTSAWWMHNHNRIIPPGGAAQRPPNASQKRVVQDLTQCGPFDRRQIKKIVHMQQPDSVLEDRQISNLMNAARAEGVEEVKKLGGDVMSVAKALKEKNDAGEGWYYDIKADIDGNVEGIFWMSPEQIRLGKRYGDVLLNDNAFNRNKYGYPLDLGIVIDNFGNSRNVFYSLHRDETSPTHEWVFKCFTTVIGRCPEVIATDRHPSLISAISRVCPLALHIYCLHHLNGNIKQHLHRIIGHDSWPGFLGEFFAVYNAVSPDAFDQGFLKDYLDSEIYPCRDRWAWAWVSQVFTAGVRTSGRCESENRINKLLGGPKQTLTQVFSRLNERTVEQTNKELIGVRDSSRRQLNHSLEHVFPNVLELLRRHAGPFALQRTWQEMEKSAFYDVSLIELEAGEAWTRGVVTPNVRERFTADLLNEHTTVNTFSDDTAFIATPYLLSLIHDRTLRIRNMYRVAYQGGGVSHVVACLMDGRYVCDCCMGSNLGVPCRHFYAVMAKVKTPTVTFHIGFIRSRWLQDPHLDVSTIAPVARRHIVHERALNLCDQNFPTVLLSNPLDPRPNVQGSASINQTLGARTVYHSANTALRQLLGNVETQDDLDVLLGDLHTLDTTRRSCQERRSKYVDPLPIKHRGRPRTARLTSAVEGVAKGGGARTRPRPRPLPRRPTPEPLDNEDDGRASSPSTAEPTSRAGDKRARSPSDTSRPPSPAADPDPSDTRPQRRKPKCSQCHQEGHNRLRCYDVTQARQEEARRKLRRKK